MVVHSFKKAVLTASHHCYYRTDNSLGGFLGGYPLGSLGPTLNHRENLITIPGGCSRQPHGLFSCPAGGLPGPPPPQIAYIRPHGDFSRSLRGLPVSLSDMKSVAVVRIATFAADGAALDRAHRSARAKPFRGSIRASLSHSSREIPLLPLQGFIGSFSDESQPWELVFRSPIGSHAPDFTKSGPSEPPPSFPWDPNSPFG